MIGEGPSGDLGYRQREEGWRGDGLYDVMNVETQTHLQMLSIQLIRHVRKNFTLTNSMVRTFHRSTGSAALPVGGVTSVAENGKWSPIPFTRRTSFKGGLNASHDLRRAVSRRAAVIAADVGQLPENVARPIARCHLIVA